MIWFLRALFTLILGSMLAVTIWAGAHQSLGDFARSPTFREPWVIATLADAYWGFITFFVWVAWKETSWIARLFWFVAIILLGNVAMPIYVLRELFRVPTTGRWEDIFSRREAGGLVLPAVLATLGAAAYFAL